MEIKLVGSNVSTNRWMAAMKDSTQEEIKQYRRECREKGLISSRDLDEAEKRQRMYFVTLYQPARFEGIIINYKLLSSLMKKLKGYHINYEVDNHKLLITYSKDGCKGTFEMYDLSKYYAIIPELPEVVIGA